MTTGVSMVREGLLVTYKWAKRIAIAIVGFTVLAVGIAMIILPGPAFIVIPVGLGILSIEFAWARRWLKTVKERGSSLVGSLKAKAERPAAGGTPPGTSPSKRDKPL